jgi:preprotein translocase subunit SecF
LTVWGLVDLTLKGGPKYGLDFKGGALIDVRFASRPPVDEIRRALGDRIKGEISVQELTGSNDVQIGVESQSAKELEAARATIVTTFNERFAKTGGKADFHNMGAQKLVEVLREPLARGGVIVSETQLQDLAKAVLQYRDTPPRSGLIRGFDELSGVPGVTAAAIGVMKQELALAPFAIRGVQTVSPKVTGELRGQALNATLLALGAMLVYIWFRFEWVYGLAAVVAVFHDMIMTIGLFSIFNKPIDLTVVAALLTLVGYSMNDTIVVFDRIRENLKSLKKETFAAVTNISINQTLSRTLLTAGLTFVTCLALLVFGGPVLNGFAFALVAGIIVGTYSSIFIASPIVVFWRDFMARRAPAAVSGGGKATVAEAKAGRAAAEVRAKK